MQAYGVPVKILTGDNEKVTQAICRQVGLPVERILLGTDLERLNDQELGRLAEDITVFAKLSPQQKARVVRVLREKGHTVGYTGDGINDAAAMQAADVEMCIRDSPRTAWAGLWRTCPGCSRSLSRRSSRGSRRFWRAGRRWPPCWACLLYTSRCV